MQVTLNHILDTFPIVRRKDEAAHGTYRTKHTILEIYDQLAAAQRTATSCASPLDPPAADARCCHPGRVLETMDLLSLGKFSSLLSSVLQSSV